MNFSLRHSMESTDKVHFLLFPNFMRAHRKEARRESLTYDRGQSRIVASISRIRCCVCVRATTMRW